MSDDSKRLEELMLAEPDGAEDRQKSIADAVRQILQDRRRYRTAMACGARPSDLRKPFVS